MIRMPISNQAARISASAIESARTRIRAEFLNSRQIENSALSAAVGARLLCKVECENPVGCFKGRGTDSFVNSLPADGKALVTASAGNFGLALAYSARQREIQVAVYAAENASPRKIDCIRSTGAIVHLIGRDFDEAKDHARDDANRSNSIFVEDGREPAITAGAGTMAMEITNAGVTIDRLIVPLGNGALLAGLGCWFRARSPKTRVVAVCAEGAPSMALSWRSHQLQTTPTVDTIADGIAVRVPITEALADIQDVVDDIVLVSDDAMKQALKFVHKHLKLVVEPSGVAGIAALLSHSSLAKGTVCSPLTGANVTEDQVKTWIAEIE